MSMHLDELLHNADWPKQTCDWPLPQLGLCDTMPVVAAAWDESKYVRVPKGTANKQRDPEEGGQFTEGVPARIKFSEAKNFREELDNWYYTGRGTEHQWQDVFDDWGDWSEEQQRRLAAEIERQLREGQYSGLLSAQYANEIGRSLAQPRNEAKRLLAQLNKSIALIEADRAMMPPEEYAPELFVKAPPKKKQPNPRDQGIPEIYLSESGKFKPGFDAKLKSDLVNSVIDLHPMETVTKKYENSVSIETQQDVATWWKERNADEYARHGWSDAEIFKMAQNDPMMPGGLAKVVRDERNFRTETVTQSTLLHRFSEEDALRILEERGWTKHLEQRESKLGLIPRVPSQDQLDRLAKVQNAWGDKMTITGHRYGNVQAMVDDMAEFDDRLVAKVTGEGATMYIGTADNSTDLDELHRLANERMGGAWGNTTMKKVPGYYFSDGVTVASTRSNSGSASLAAHEFGHAIGAKIGVDHSDELYKWHERLYPQLSSYFKQGGVHGFKGRKELWAEGVAFVIRNDRLAAQGQTPSFNPGPFKTRASYLLNGSDTEAKQASDQLEFYDWVRDTLDLVAVNEYSHPNRDGYGVAPPGFKWQRDRTGLDRLVPE